MNVYDEVKLFLTSIVNDLDSRIGSRTIPPRDFPMILVMIPIVQKYFSVQNDWKRFGFEICKYYKNEIEAGRIRDLSMFSGLGYVSFAVEKYSKATGELNNFSRQLNELLYIKCENLSKTLMRKQYVEMSDYDTIAGISGIVLYLVNKKVGVFPNACKYLSGLFDFDKFGELKIRIKEKNSYTQNSDICTVGCYLNFGLSHGMIGPMLALSKLYCVQREDIFRKMILSSLNCASKLYDEYSSNEYNIKWPSQMDYRIYRKEIDQSNIEYFEYPSWCYGSLSILNSIEIIEQNTGLTVLQKHKFVKMGKYSELIGLMNIHDMSLCHGLTGEVLFLKKFGVNIDLYKNKLRTIMETSKQINKEEFNFYRYLYNMADNAIVRKYVGHNENLSLLEGIGGIFLTFSNIIFGDTTVEEMLFLE